MTTFSHSAIMQEVDVQLRFMYFSIIVLLNQLVDSDTMLVGIRFEDVRKVRCFRL